MRVNLYISKNNQQILLNFAHSLGNKVLPDFEKNLFIIVHSKTVCWTFQVQQSDISTRPTAPAYSQAIPYNCVVVPEAFGSWLHWMEQGKLWKTWVLERHKILLDSSRPYTNL